MTLLETTLKDTKHSKNLELYTIPFGHFVMWVHKLHLSLPHKCSMNQHNLSA